MCKCRKNKSSCQCNSITMSDFCSNGRLSKTFTIMKPGKYCLSKSISFDPLDVQPIDYDHPIAAIVINSDNVELNLCGNVLSQANKVQAVIGVLVLTGHKNVTIVNGVIESFSYLGIYVQGGQENIFIGDIDDKLIIRKCGYGSIYQYVNDDATQFINPGGLLLGESYVITDIQYGIINTSIVQNVLLEQNGNSAMTIGYFTNVQILNCDFVRNYDNRSGAPFDSTVYMYGLFHYSNADFEDPESNNLQIYNSHFDDNVAEGDDTYINGTYLGYLINGSKMSYCTSNRNHSVDNGNGVCEVHGYTYTGNDGIIMEDCESIGNYSSGFTDGFHYSGIGGNGGVTNGKGIVYRRCLSVNNKSSGAINFGRAFGFLFAFCYGVTIEDCQSYDNTLESDLYPGRVAGFGLTGFLVATNVSSNSYTIKNCQSSRNKCLTPDNANSFSTGLLIWGSPDGFDQYTNFVVKNSVMQDNTGCPNNSGVYLINRLNGPQPTYDVIVQECNIQQQHFGVYLGNTSASIVQKNTITDVDFGIYLDGNATCNSVNNNYVTNSGVAYTDLLNPSTSLFSNNISFGANTPYDVTYAFGPVPVSNGSLLTGFPTGAQILDNVAMDNPTCNRVAIVANDKVSFDDFSRVSNLIKKRIEKMKEM